MRKLFYYFLVGVFLYVGAITLKNKPIVQEALLNVRSKVGNAVEINSPCVKPLQYAIGKVDPQFNLSEEDFLAKVQQAEKIWENQAKKQLFEYNPKANFKINLIFDDRQLQSNEAEKLTANLSQLEVAQNKLDAEYASLNGSYSKVLEKYNADVNEYKKQVKKYNKAVANWNAGDRTSQTELDTLQKEKSDLADFYQKIQKEQIAVNALVGKTNKLVTQEKKVVNDYNSQVETYKEKYGSVQEFEKGVYQGTEINIYQFKQLADLKMTLVHELGHALGFGHVENSKSIMYYLLSDQDIQNLTLSNEDISELNKVCQLN